MAGIRKKKSWTFNILSLGLNCYEVALSDVDSDSDVYNNCARFNEIMNNNLSNRLQVIIMLMLIDVHLYSGKY